MIRPSSSKYWLRAEGLTRRRRGGTFTQTRLLTLIVTIVLGASTATFAQNRAISTPNAPEALGPYSQAIQTGNMLFVSGQIAIDPRTRQFDSGAAIEDQTRRVLDNLRAILEANGMTMTNVVSTTVFLKDLDDFSKMNAVYATYFSSIPPARATVEVAKLPKGARIEISAIAVTNAPKP